MAQDGSPMLRYAELDLIDQLVDDATPEREVQDWARVIVEEVTHDQDHDHTERASA